ncbi:DUF1127 domain-containing protein [Pacificibacter marinus]|uniref:YjiS-like domain-containing protein n=1 Tax=Pacificibacter marinus TaxID=658057 RepID=A0A1Y5RR32_9RHOB|nr:DUF1127 domain-containing protein [Pacificibacter marinus]SEL31439.1 Uncharacterized conserved protein YjiS, DUF1127 family [Pacificibacter marinus]SLN22483.1 hypothetical protein PAM7971_00682 [Pacificibacter marinus]
MAYAASNTKFNQVSLAERFAKAFAKAIAKFSRNVAEARYMSELFHLSDRELADIGINRADIPRIAREAAQD